MRDIQILYAMNKTGLILFLVANGAMAGEYSEDIPANKDHFGCWESSIFIGLEKKETLCVAAEAVSYSLEFPDHRDKTSCSASGSLAGFGDDGSRMYIIYEGVCSNNNSHGAILFDCERKDENLECENVDLLIFAEEDKIDYTHKILFYPSKAYNQAKQAGTH